MDTIGCGSKGDEITKTDSSRPLDALFTPAIRTAGAYPTYLQLDGSEAVLGTRRPVKVGGTLDGHPFEATLMPSGNRPHWLPLRAALCRTIGKAEAGQTVTVHLLRRNS